eukprot:1002962-Rhodomonas_salina.1
MSPVTPSPSRSSGSTHVMVPAVSHVRSGRVAAAEATRRLTWPALAILEQFWELLQGWRPQTRCQHRPE